MELGARISELRVRRQESLQQVADAAGVSKAHIWDLEKGRAGNPSLTLLKGIADHFDVSVAWLVGEDPQASDADPQAAALFRQAKDLHADDVAIVRSILRVLLNRRRKGPLGV